MSNFNYTSKVGLDFSQSIIATAVNQATRYIPTNLITDGGFESSDNWTQASNYWTIANGKASAVAGSVTNYQYLDQTITFPEPGTYEAALDVIDFVTGIFYISYTAGTATFTASAYPSISNNGTISQRYYVTVAGTITLRARAYNSTVGAIDNFRCYNVNAETIGVDAADIVMNGAFTTDTSGWTASQNSGTAVISSVSGQLLVDNNSSATYGRAYQVLPTVIGQAYQVNANVIATSTLAAIRIVNSDNLGATPLANEYATGAASIECNFVATATSTYIMAVNYSATTTDTSTFDNIVVRKSYNIITNGSFGYDAQWTKETGWTIASNVATITTPGSTTSIYQSVTLSVAGTYEFAAQVTSISAGTISLTTTANTAIYTAESTPTTTTTGWLRRKIYVHSAGTIYLKITGTSTAVASIDNVSCWLIEDDQSAANNNGFEVHGQLRRVAVAPGADLRAFTGFSSTAYLRQPYTSALDFGTGDFTFSCWMRTGSTSGFQYILQRSSSNYTAANQFSIIYSPSLNKVYMSKSGGTTVVGTSALPSIYTWHHYVFTRSNGTIYLYEDGSLAASAASTDDFTSTTALVKIGCDGEGSSYFGGDVVNIQLIGNALTAADAKEIYNREKLQFEAYAAYAEYDAPVQIEIPIINSASQSNKDMRHINESISQVRETLFLSSKREWQLPTAPIPYASASVTDLQQVRNFIDSVKKGQTFTFSERKGFDLFDDTRSVILDSIDHNYAREANLVDHYRLNLKVREA